MQGSYFNSRIYIIFAIFNKICLSFFIVHIVGLLFEILFYILIHDFHFPNNLVPMIWKFSCVLSPCFRTFHRHQKLHIVQRINSKSLLANVFCDKACYRVLCLYIPLKIKKTIWNDKIGFSRDFAAFSMYFWKVYWSPNENRIFLDESREV